VKIEAHCDELKIKGSCGNRPSPKTPASARRK